MAGFRVEKISREEWLRRLEILRRFTEAERHSSIPSSHRVDDFRLGQWVTMLRRKYCQQGIHAEGRALSAERCRDLESVPWWDWSQGSASWLRKYRILEEWIERTGTALVPAAYITGDGFALGGWVCRQRVQHRRGRLEDGRKESLERLPGWEWNPENRMRVHRSLVEARLRHLIWKAEEGQSEAPVTTVAIDEVTYHCDIVLDGHRTVVEYDGGVWHAGREEHDRRKSEELQKGGWRVLRVREHPLDIIGPHDIIVSPTASIEEIFNATREMLKEAGVALAQCGTVDPSALEQEVVRTLSRDLQWEETLRVWKNYVKRTGGQRIHVSHEEEGKKLGQWVAVQRRAYSRGRLAAVKIAALEEDPDWRWAPKIGGWEAKVEDVAAWCETAGHSMMPRSYRSSGGEQLGIWLYQQRWHHSRGELSTARQAVLEAIPNWSWETASKVGPALGQEQQNITICRGCRRDGCFRDSEEDGVICE